MKFVTTPKLLILQLDRKEQFAALKAKITVDRKQVKALSWCDTFDDWRRWEVRLPGAAIPNRLLAGSYWTEEGWDFLYIRRPIGVREPVGLNVIRIDLNDHEKFMRVIISATEEDYAHIKKWYEKSPNKKIKKGPSK